MAVKLSPDLEREFILHDLRAAASALGDLLDSARDLHQVSPSGLAALMRCLSRLAETAAPAA